MKYYIWLVIGLLFLGGCKAHKAENDLTYLQNVDRVALDQAREQQDKATSTLQVGDQLVITVSGNDLDVIKPFNQNYSSGQTIQNPNISGNISNQVAPVTGPTYVIDSSGNISFPLIGLVNTIGKTTEDLRQELETAIKKYVRQPIVAVRLVNFRVNVVGEVTRPGEYVIPDANATVLRALSLAGDLTLYGNRKDLLIIRNVDGVRSEGRIDLTDANFINSPYYELKQGDIIYVTPNANRQIAARQNPNTGLYISIASVALGVLGLLVTVFKK